jgi:hypothetical protein
VKLLPVFHHCPQELLELLKVFHSNWYERPSCDSYQFIATLVYTGVPLKKQPQQLPRTTAQAIAPVRGTVPDFLETPEPMSSRFLGYCCRQLRRSTEGVRMARIFMSRTLLRIKSFAAVSKASSNEYPQKEMPNQTIILMPPVSFPILLYE